MDVIFPIFGIFIIITFIFLFFFFIPVGLWVKAWAANVKLPLRQLIGMRLRKIPPGLVADALISSRKAGLGINIDQLETHYLASGNVVRVTNALIASGKAGIDLDFEQAAAIDLAGRDVLEAVKTSVNPIVIDCPATGKVSAVAKDGIQLLAKARVTVRTNIERLVGGATQETIIARVGEGIVSAIGSSLTYKTVLENPDNISKTVLKKGLDSGTAYEILSIDIADIDVGQNVGAYLMTDQAEADLKVARAKAETRRAMAIAAEQEMKAAEQEMRAKVVEAEVLIPEAMADSFRKGNLGILDYYRFRNIEADTSMRDELAKSQKKGKKPGDGSK